MTQDHRHAIVTVRYNRLMRALILLPILALAACAEVRITPANYDAAFEFCKPHGGLSWVTVQNSYATHDQIKIICVSDDVYGYRTVKKPKPLAPEAAASGASAP